MKARTVINQCYIVQEKLGEDGFCELWRVTSVFAANEFLLRILKPLPGIEERLPDLRAEVLATSGIIHPAVAETVELEKFEGRWFLASSYLDQKTLRSLHTQGMTFGLELLCRYVIEMAQGVDAFHGVGRVYACLSADNVLFQITQGKVEGIQVQNPGYAAILDLLGEADGDDWLETWAYAAPEVKRGGAKPDQRADVYSLGIHLFRFLSGNLPYPRDRGFVRKEPASLAHVAKALLRRGVPERLVRIAIRALRPDPDQRFPDCVRFIAELRDFTDERRSQILKRSGVDPLAGLGTLNRAGGKIGASQIVRSLDTADYFRLLSEAPPEVPKLKPARVFPFTAFSDPEAVKKLETSEAATPDTGRLAEDEYIRAARTAVSHEPWAVREEDLSKAPPAEAPEAGTPAEAASPSPAEPEKPEEPADGLVLGPPKGVNREGRGTVAGGISWIGSRFRQDNLVGIMESAFARARHGRGTLRFIQEPSSGPVAAALGRAIARFRAEAFLVDAAGLGKNADATDLLRVVRAPLASALAALDKRSVRMFGRRLSAAGGEPILACAPLGKPLYGADLPEPDPDFLESEEGAALAARALASFGRRSKPLVLIIRGGELVGPTAHAVLLELAKAAPRSPLCCFVFFRVGKDAPDWHVLSKLAKAVEAGTESAARLL